MNIEDADTLPVLEPIRKKQRRGFALMNPDRLKEISAKGGKKCPDAARGFSNREVALKAAHLGGRRKR
jgi:general stress protein YciG